MRYIASLLCFAAACGIDDIPDDELLATDEQELAKPPPGDDGPIDKPKTGPISPPPSNLHVRTSTDIATVLDFTCGKNSDKNNWFRQTETGAFLDMGESPACEDVMQSVWDVAIQPETNYCYYVKSSNSTHSANTNTLCLKTPAPKTAPTPAEVSFGAITTNTIVVRVQDKSLTERYFRVWRRPSGGSWSVIRDQLRYTGSGCGTQGAGPMKSHRPKDCSFYVTDSGLAPGTLYEYVVEAGYFFDGGSIATATLRSDSRPAFARTRSNRLPPIEEL